MTDRELQDLLDARPDAASAERALSGASPETRREALALLALARAAASQPRAAPSADFAARAMARVRAAPPPRRGLWARVLERRLPLGALAGSAAAAILALGIARQAGPFGDAAATSDPSAPDAPFRAQLALLAPGARDVRVAGDFNGWRPEATPLVRDRDGRWRVVVPLERGRRYAYMFVVDGEWVTDPAATARAADGFGGENAILDT